MKTKNVVSTLVLVLTSTSIAFAADSKAKKEHAAPAPAKKEAAHKAAHKVSKFPKSKMTFAEVMKDKSRDVANAPKSVTEKPVTKAQVLKMNSCDVIDKNPTTGKPEFVARITFKSNGTYTGTSSGSDAYGSAYEGAYETPYEGGYDSAYDGQSGISGTWEVKNGKLGLTFQGNDRLMRFNPKTLAEGYCYFHAALLDSH